MADISALVYNLTTDGTVATIARNPRAQFGTPTRQYLGATLLPEMIKTENAYRETAIRYRSIIANDGTRYSPSQKKGSTLVGDMLVELADSDIASEFTAQDYDAVIKLLQSGGDMEATAQLIRWLDRTVRIPLAELNEKHRWTAICNAAVYRRGDDGYREDVTYPNPTGQRVTAGGTWSSNSYNPMTDIFAMATFAASKGYTISRIVTSRAVASIMANNTNLATRSGRVAVSSTGQIQGVPGLVTMADMNGILNADGLPNMELYDLQYMTQTDAGYFLPRGTMVMFATTGRDASIDLGDGENMLLENTIGYVGVGRPAGQATPGVKLRMEAFENKPPRVECEGWQTSLPVITDPESIFVISGIA